MNCFPHDPPRDEDGPDEDAAFLYPSGPLGALTGVSYDGRHLGEWVEEEDARRALRARMDADRYWPSVYYMSDHGNLHPTSV